VYFLISGISSGNTDFDILYFFFEMCVRVQDPKEMCVRVQDPKEMCLRVQDPKEIQDIKI